MSQFGVKFEVCNNAGVWVEREVIPTSWASFNDVAKFAQMTQTVFGTVRNVQVRDVATSFLEYRTLDYRISEFYSASQEDY